MHGAALVLLDGMGLGVALSPAALASLKKACAGMLAEQVTGCNCSVHMSIVIVDVSCTMSTFILSALVFLTRAIFTASPLCLRPRIFYRSLTARRELQRFINSRGTVDLLLPKMDSHLKSGH